MIKKFLMVLIALAFLTGCTVIHYDYTGPRVHRVQRVHQHYWSHYQPCWSMWWTPLFWYDTYYYWYSYYVPVYHGHGHYSVETPYIPRSGVKRTVTKRQLQSPRNRSGEAVRGRVTRSTVSRTQLTRGTSTRSTGSVSSRQKGTKTVSVRKKK
jgi:hypothetical protein